MKKRKHLIARRNREEGFTLVEVIISILIMSIVTLMIFSFLDSGISTYVYGVDRIDEEAQLRLCAYKTTQRVRNIFQVDIYDMPGSVPGNQYIYLSGNTLVYYDNGIETNLSGPIITDIDFALTSINDKYLLVLRLAGEEDVIQTEILLNNIQQEDIMVNIANGAIETEVLEIITAP